MCTTPGCDRPVLAKGLCRPCYNNEWQKAKRLADCLADPDRQRVCPICNEAFTAKDPRRIYCDKKRCKWKANSRSRARASQPRVRIGRKNLVTKTLVSREGRICRHCQEAIPLEREGGSFYCSEKCNRKACALRKRIARNKALDRHCAVCKDPLDLLVALGTIYCGDPCRRFGAYAQKYAMTPADLQTLFDTHNQCAGCGTSDWGPLGRHVDHDHSSGRVRGILCNRCNTALGQVQESTERLEGLIAYLKQHAIA